MGVRAMLLSFLLISCTTPALPPTPPPTDNAPPTSCASAPCLHGGICSEASGAVSCSCTGGYSGPTCATPPAVCMGSPCQNGGECYDREGALACHCPVSRTGPTCSDAAAVGLTSRPSNPTCVAFAQPSTSGSLQWVPRGGGAGGLSLMMMRHTSSGHWYEAYRTGEVYVLAPNGTRSANPLVTVTTQADGEMGLLGLALHPSFSSAPYLYLYYTQLADGPGSDVRILIDRFTVSNPSTAPAIDPASRKNVFTFDRQANHTNHLGGSIEFDPLASVPTLYAALGDGGGSHYTCNAPSPAGSANGDCKAQYLATYHGKLLRFDVSNTAMNATFTPEIVGLGLRNPFRWSFDTVTGDLWLGDVGEAELEEVDFVPRAQLPQSGQPPINFGWPCLEGFQSYASGSICNALGPVLNPVHAYDHSLGVSVIGGRVYRGSLISGAAGTYVFNDIFPADSGPPWRLAVNPTQDPGDPADDYTRSDIGGSSDPRGFVAYTEDIDGELYAMTTWGGVYRLEAVAVGPPVLVPQTLSDTGCFAVGGEPRAGLIPFDVRAPLWSDGASKRRWLALPDGTSITTTSRGDFQFPNGTVLAKEFTQGDVRVETRLFVKHDDGQWAGYTYAWMNDSGVALSDAELVDSTSAVRAIPGTAHTWQFPSRGQCMGCHTQAAGFSLGLEIGQLNDTFAYPGGTSANQLHTLTSIGVLSSSVSGVLDRHALPKYGDVATSTERRAHAYLHSNCASCHQPGAAGHGGRSNMPDIRYDVFGSNDLRALLCGRAATAEHLGLGAGAQLVSPGTPGTWASLGSGGSVLSLRMSAREAIAGTMGAMPPVGTRIVDEQEGLALVSAWIQSVTCP